MKGLPDGARRASPLQGLIGLGYRARNVIVGVDAVRRELQGDRCWCVVLADDASPRAVERVARLATAKQVPVLQGPSAVDLGAYLGKPPVMVVGVRDRALAGGMVQLMEGLRG